MSFTYKIKTFFSSFNRWISDRKNGDNAMTLRVAARMGILSYRASAEHSSNNSIARIHLAMMRAIRMEAWLTSTKRTTMVLSTRNPSNFGRQKFEVRTANMMMMPLAVTKTLTAMKTTSKGPRSAHDVSRQVRCMAAANTLSAIVATTRKDTIRFVGVKDNSRLRTGEVTMMA